MDFKTDPGNRKILKAQVLRSIHRVPGGKDMRFMSQDKGCIARSHQGEGTLGAAVIVENRQTTRFLGEHAAAGTEAGGGSLTHGREESG